MKQTRLAVLFFALALLGAIVVKDAIIIPKFSLPFCRSNTPRQAHTVEQQHRTAHKIRFEDMFDEAQSGHCSGTAVGSHALLTAGHCVVDTNKVYLDNSDTATTILYEIIDGQDHVIYIVDREFQDYAEIEERGLIQNEWVHMWGAPLEDVDVSRAGYFTTIKP